MKKHNVALLGCGGYGGYLAEMISKDSRTNLSYCIDTDEVKAKVLATKFGCKYDITPSRALDDESVDISIVAASADQNAPLAKAAILKGKKVFCEKPMANSVDAARGLVQAVQNTNGILQMDFPYRHMDAIKHLKGMLENGEIKGPVHYLFTTLNEPHIKNDQEHYEAIKNHVKSGGPMIVGGAHYLDLLVNFADPLRIRVSGVGTPMKKDIQGNTLESAVIECEDGSSATIVLGWLVRMSSDKFKHDKEELGMPWPAPVPSDIRLYAENLTAVFDYYATRELEIQRDGKPIERVILPESFLAGQERYVKCIEKGWQSFLDAIESGRKPQPNELDGLKNIILSEAIKTAINERRTVDITLQS